MSVYTKFSTRPSISIAGETLALEAKFPSVRPCLGIGYGHSVSKGLRLFMDLGVAYGKPKATLTSSEGLTTAAGADIEIERKKLQDDLDKLKVWPVIKIGWGYTF